MVNEAYMNWSGGKDSALCLDRVLRDAGYRVDCLLTSLSATHDRISMHGVRRELLNIQAAHIGLPLQTIELPEEPSMEEYENVMSKKCRELRKSGLTHAIFGDIFLEDLRIYRENKLRELDLQCRFPLWKIPTRQLMDEFIALGFKAIIVSVNESLLDRRFCGRLLDAAFLRDLPPTVDPCGENGEYHSFVFDGPIFKIPVPFRVGEIVHKTYKAPVTPSNGPMEARSPVLYGYYFCDLIAGKKST
jgi:uncharacterized protein (TIGR00290 family)